MSEEELFSLFHLLDGYYVLAREKADRILRNILARLGQEISRGY